MPSLIYPLMAALHSMAPDNAEGVSEVEAFTCKSGCNIRRSRVKSISFGGMYPISHLRQFLISFIHEAITPITIEHCDCISPAIALLHQGSWPTTPIKASTWAFDIKLLEFMRLLSVHGAPNISALSNATVAFLIWSGVPDVPVSVSYSAPLRNNSNETIWLLSDTV